MRCGLGLRVWVFMVEGGLGFRVWGLGFWGLQQVAAAVYRSWVSYPSDTLVKGAALGV